MSALGQRLMFASQNVTAASPPIATAKADIRRPAITNASRSNHQAVFFRAQNGVRFTSESGHVRCASEYLLRANSGQQLDSFIGAAEYGAELRAPSPSKRKV